MKLLLTNTNTTLNVHDTNNTQACLDEKMERGEAALAMRLYRRGLEIAPENEAARAALEALEAGDGD